MKISVIIPIYKVEALIERCATTLMEQTLRDVEYIFVDDATPDRSIEILQNVISRYPERKEQIHIVHHVINKGLPAARNTGLSMAQGEYIFHCDSDDYVEPAMLEELYGIAEKKNADIVWCDWYLTFAVKERYMRQPSYSTPQEVLKAMLSGAMAAPLRRTTLCMPTSACCTRSSAANMPRCSTRFPGPRHSTRGSLTGRRWG